jgi:biopolymer transport protein ExbD
MAIQSRFKSNVEFSTTTQADLVFLLLIFFMITSTLVSPNAIKLLLPNSTSKTASNRNFEVYIDENLDYSILQGKDLTAIAEEDLQEAIGNRLMMEKENASVVVRADKSVPIQNVVYIIDAVNLVNESGERQHKVILATKPVK